MAATQSDGASAPVDEYPLRLRFFRAPPAPDEARAAPAGDAQTHRAREAQSRKRPHEAAADVIDLTAEDDDAAPRKVSRIVAVIDLTGADTEDAAPEDAAESEAEEEVAAEAEEPRDSVAEQAEESVGAAAPTVAAPAPPSARVPPTAKLQSFGKQKHLVTPEERATLRRLAKELEPEHGPDRWKEMCATSEICLRLGLNTKQLRKVVKVKPLEPPSTAQWSDELQTQLVAAVAAHGRLWAVIRRDAADGAFRPFRLEDLRHHYDKPAAKPGYLVGGTRVRGVTLVGRGRFQVTFNRKYVGMCNTLPDAAALWDKHARAAGLPDSALNALPEEAVQQALEAFPDPAPKREHAKYSMSDDGGSISLRAGHCMTREAFLAAAESYVKQCTSPSRCTWGGLAQRLGMGDLVGKSHAVHFCFAALRGVDHKKTLWQAYHGVDEEAPPAAAAAGDAQAA